MEIKIFDKKYPMAATLRVAYKLQGCNNHKSYIKIFESIGDMTLEEQIQILQCSFAVANPNETTITAKVFMDYIIDHYSLKELMNFVQQIVEGIIGKEPENEAAAEGEDVIILPSAN